MWIDSAKAGDRRPTGVAIPDQAWPVIAKLFSLRSKRCRGLDNDQGNAATKCRLTTV
jgi:hypothetical protein